MISFARIARGLLAATLALATVAGSSAADRASGVHGAVAADQRLATQAGIAVLRAGGNAVDAAVAIGYTLAVTYPAAGNIGGGGFMLVRRADGAAHFYDFRETAPAAATPTMYLDARGAARPEASTVGMLSAGVPGTVAGLEAARIGDGTMSRHALLAPALAYARDGFVLDAADARTLARDYALLARFPASAAIFGRGGRALVAGERLVQRDLARTLAAIDRRGPDGFYRGPIAHRLAASVRAGGGIITEADLASYRVKMRAPLKCAYRDATIVTSPPPSSGGFALCQITKMLDDARPSARRSVADAHREIEAERRSFADRNTYLGDPDFVRNPLARLLSREHVAALVASIRPQRATPSSANAPAVHAHEGHNTTNFSVMDGAGNAVDVTYTLNAGFGSGAVAAGTGVLLNDEMDDFTTAPGKPNQFGLVQGATNAVGPGRRPLSSMSPTIVVRGGRAILAVGAAGGPRIITTTLDIVRGVVAYGMPVADALDAPRMHHQWLPDVVYVQPRTLAPDVRATLTADGYTFTEQKSAHSIANAVERTPDGFHAAHDPGQPTGSALGY